MAGTYDLNINQGMTLKIRIIRHERHPARSVFVYLTNQTT